MLLSVISIVNISFLVVICYFSPNISFFVVFSLLTFLSSSTERVPHLNFHLSNFFFLFSFFFSLQFFFFFFFFLPSPFFSFLFFSFLFNYSSSYTFSPRTPRYVSYEGAQISLHSLEVSGGIAFFFFLFLLSFLPSFLSFFLSFLPSFLPSFPQLLI